MTERVLLTGRVEDGAAAVTAVAELAAGGVQVVPWLVPGGPRDDDPLLAAARAAADREEAVPRGPAPDRRPETAPDVRVQRQALIVVRRMLDLQAGQVLLAEAPDLALPLLDAIAAEAAARGGVVCLRVGVDGLERALLEHSAPEAARGARRDRPCGPRGGGRPVPLAGRASRRRARGHRRVAGGGTRAGAGRVRKLRFARAADGSLRWALTAVPCAPYAARSGLDEAAFADLLYAAAGCDVDDPIALWERRAAVQEELRTRLEAGARDPHRGAGHRPRAAASAAARGARRRPAATCPTARSSPARRGLRRGRRSRCRCRRTAAGRGWRRAAPLRARRGRRGHRRGAARTCSTRRSASTRARAAWARSASARTTRSTGGTGRHLLDEKIGGIFHLAIGARLRRDGRHQRRGLHWDLVCDLRDGGEILLDGEPIYRDGRSSPPAGAVTARPRAARAGPPPAGARRAHAGHGDRQQHARLVLRRRPARRARRRRPRTDAACSPPAPTCWTSAGRRGRWATRSPPGTRSRASSPSSRRCATPASPSTRTAPRSPRRRSRPAPCFVNDYTGGYDPDAGRRGRGGRGRPRRHALPGTAAREPVPLLRGHRRRGAARPRGPAARAPSRRRGGGTRSSSTPASGSASRPASTSILLRDLAPRDARSASRCCGLLAQGVHGRRERAADEHDLAADDGRGRAGGPRRRGDAAAARRRGVPAGDRAGRRRPDASERR